MAECSFNIPFADTVENVYERAKKSVEKQGGNFTGDISGGSFDLSLFGNTIAGSYTVQGTQLAVSIHEKPFMVPCAAIESFLKKQIGA